MNAQAKLGTTALTHEDDGAIFRQLLEKVSSIERDLASPPVKPMEILTFDELERWAERAARSTMVPKDYQGKPDNIILAVELGAELGLRRMQSLQNIAVINGRPSVWGDAMLALCMTHPAYVSTEETLIGEGENLTARCVTIRRGEPPVIRTFSVQDAKTAKLWNKKAYNGQDTPWVTNPGRMLQMRARGFALRDAFPDKLKGLISAEEASDYQHKTTKTFAPPPPAQALASTSAPNADLAGDGIPEHDGPAYPFTTSNGTKVFHSAADWIARWRKLISDCKKIEALDKLESARAINAPVFVTIRTFDPETVDTIETDIRDAIDAGAEESVA